jgi:Carboxylesterase family
MKVQLMRRYTGMCSPFPYIDRYLTTGHSPASHQPPSGFDNEVNLFIQQPLPKPETTFSDVDCLNLNITIPQPKAGEALAGRKLPVFVWIHGGGFVLGANNWPQYGHARLVKLAAERNVPVVGVGIKYVTFNPDSSVFVHAGSRGVVSADSTDILPASVSVFQRS